MLALGPVQSPCSIMLVHVQIPVPASEQAQHGSYSCPRTTAKNTRQGPLCRQNPSVSRDLSVSKNIPQARNSLKAEIFGKHGTLCKQGSLGGQEPLASRNIPQAG
eukprot:362384-Chlamydomonas_euryale.AAC.6